MRAKLLTLGLFTIAALFGCFVAQPARADIQTLSNTGPLTAATTGPGGEVDVKSLSGQSNCAGQETGTPGPIDVEGSIDGGANWTALAVTSGGSTVSQPFTPTAGQAFFTAPTAMTIARIRADSTWSGQSAVAKLNCSASVVRASGGGSAATLVEPIYSPAANQIGFDYSHAGTFTGATNFTGSLGWVQNAWWFDVDTTPAHHNPGYCGSVTSDTNLGFGANYDGPEDWLLQNYNSNFRLVGCANYEGSGLSEPVFQVYGHNLSSALKSITFYDNNTTGWPVVLSSAISNGGCAQFDPLNGSGPTYFNGQLTSIGSEQGCAVVLPLGANSVSPTTVTGTCASVASGGTACPFPNSFAFADTTYTCALGVEGTSPTAASYVNTAVGSITIYAAAGTPTVAFSCTR
jgi:hypothetical protein